MNKIALSSNDDKRLQSIGSIKIYAYWTSKDIVSEKEEIKYTNIIKWYKNDWRWWCYKRKHKEHNPNWPQILDQPYIILITGGSGSWK